MLEFKARTNLKLQVTDRQIEIIIGTILGDGYIHPLGKIQLEQSSKYLQYINWKYEELRNLAYSPPKLIQRIDKRSNKIYEGARFWLRQYFRPLRQTFYPKGKKIVPRIVSKYFTALCLAVWYMDDGNLYRGRNLKIATDGFDSKSRVLLKNLLLTKFGIKSTIHVNGKLRISSESLERFKEIVRPFIQPSMIHKIS